MLSSSSCHPDDALIAGPARYGRCNYVPTCEPGCATKDAIRLQVRDTLRCAASVDGGVTGMPMADFERTVALTFERW